MINDFVSKEDINLFVTSGRFVNGAIYVNEGMENMIATFDLLIRDLPLRRNFFVFGGLEHVIHYLRNFHFTRHQLSFLKKSFRFSKKVWDYYERLRFSGDMWALPEGTIFFPGEPVLRITAPIVEAQLFEQYFTNTVMLQTMLATKIARVMHAANGKDVEIGFKRTHGIDAAMKADRVVRMLGAKPESLVLASMKRGIAAKGSGLAVHFFISSFSNEREAFRAFLRHNPEGILLVDTYEVKNGIKNFITVAKELEQRGKELRALVLDSGDLLTLSHLARRMLNAAGLHYVKIIGVGNLDEYKITMLEKEGAPIDVYSASTAVVNVIDAPSLEVVYKLSEVRTGKLVFPKMKLASAKQSLPGRKQIYRISKSGRYHHDVIGLANEKIDGKRLLIPIIRKGRLVYTIPPLENIGNYYHREAERFAPQLFSLTKRIQYSVEINPRLHELIKGIKGSIS